jgi:hypothetical protein
MPFVKVETENNIGWTFLEETNAAMLEFLDGEVRADTAPATTTRVAATSC